MGILWNRVEFFINILLLFKKIRNLFMKKKKENHRKQGPQSKIFIMSLIITVLIKTRKYVFFFWKMETFSDVERNESFLIFLFHIYIMYVVLPQSCEMWKHWKLGYNAIFLGGLSIRAHNGTIVSFSRAANRNKSGRN